jgi:hypothetical protein
MKEDDCWCLNCLMARIHPDDALMLHFSTDRERTLFLETVLRFVLSLISSSLSLQRYRNWLTAGISWDLTPFVAISYLLLQNVPPIDDHHFQILSSKSAL